MNAIYFSSSSEFRAWLKKHHKTETELLVGYYKVGTKKPSMTWSESVDQALCFGWIDGIRRSVDEERYTIRFTPRKKNSIWSAVNIKKVEALTKAKLMTPAGLEAYGHRTDGRSGIYSHEKEPTALSAGYEKQFKANKRAWTFFKEQAPSYQKARIQWVMAARQEKTRQSRLEKLISKSEQNEKIY